MALAGRPVADVHGPDRWRLRAVADRHGRRRCHTADHRPPLPLLVRRRGRAARPGARRLSPLDPDRDARPVAARWRRRPASPDDVQRRRPRRARAGRARRAPLDRRRARHPGLAHPRRRQAPTARHGDPRRPAHALRLVADVGVPGPGGGRDERLLLQPARLRGLRRGVQRRQPPRLGPGPDARRPRRRRRAHRRRPRRPGSPGRHRRLVRRLPDELDRRPHRPVPGGDDLPLGQRHGDALPDRRHLGRRLGRLGVRGDAVGATRTTSARSRR